MKKSILTRLDEYIEFANAVHRFSDAGFYEDLKREIEGKQAKIDSLMLEYCPDEMTEEQITEWNNHQIKVETL